MQHIDELTEPPTVGKMYWVPCVKPDEVWWPLLGTVHEDAELGVIAPHIHYDGRFLSVAQVFANRVAIGRSADLFGLRSLAARLSEASAIQVVHNAAPGFKVTQRRRRCNRQAMTFPLTEVAYILEPRYAKAQAVDCRVCPHRGFRLDQQPVDRDGGVVCPGHGLRWHRASGRLMPRLPVKARGEGT